MICPNCGMDIPEGSIACPTCGYHTGAAQADPNAQYNAGAAPSAQYVDPTQAAYGTPYPAAAPAKKKTGLVIGIIAGVVVIAVVAVCLILFLGGGKNGRYSCDLYSAFGIDFYLDVDGDEVTMVMEYDTDGDGEITDDERESQDGTIEFDGDVCTITIDGEAKECEYDKKEGTITISDDDYGMEITFTKED